MPKKILIIEDEKIVSQYMASFFRNAGYEVTTAETASQAYELANGAAPDLVLLDLLLPDTDGVEILESLKAAHPKRPVIIVTGIAPDEQILEECANKGADGYVTKDSTVDHLLMHVKRAIG